MARVTAVDKRSSTNQSVLFVHLFFFWVGGGRQILHPSRQPRDAANPCGSDNGGCSHLCLLSFNGTFRCHCPHVMKLADDGRSCVRNERVLLFSRTNEIRGVDLDNPYYHIIPPISMPQVGSPTPDGRVSFDFPFWFLLLLLFYSTVGRSIGF